MYTSQHLSMRRGGAPNLLDLETKLLPFIDPGTLARIPLSCVSNYAHPSNIWRSDHAFHFIDRRDEQPDQPNP